MQRHVGFYHISYVARKVDDEAAANCSEWQTEEELMLHAFEDATLASSNAQAVGATCRYFWVEPRWFEDFYTKEQFDHELVY